MDLAKVTSKGQITIPVEIRELLGLKTGSKVIFFQKDGEIIIKNAAMIALEEIQNEFEGEAERLGLETEDDVVEMIKQYRKDKKSKNESNA